MNRLTQAIATRVLAWAKNREPDFVIGEPDRPYLNRHWLLPRNPFFNIYVHQFLRSDDERALHDHPWMFNASLLLEGNYVEWVPSIQWFRAGLDDIAWVSDPLKPDPIQRREGSLYVRFGCAPHRVQLIDNQPVWTLFMTGPKWRTWGFYCPKRWVPWQDFCEPTNKGQIGKGCD